jgi:meso-butanediol dehydrogenase/(S,S)-butanediol dehydrogenase/diacetyl reductase
MSMADVRGRFAGKVAVVTGGASGIGLAIVRGLHREGARIVCADINRETLGAVERQLDERIVCTTADVTSEADAEALMRLAVERFGALHCAFVSVREQVA